MRGIIKVSIIVATIFLFTPKVYGTGVGELLHVSGEQNLFQKELNKETKSYNAIKAAIEKGKIKKGDSQESIEKRFGTPIIKMEDTKYAEKWAYKPGDSSWSDGVKIYLYFNEENALQGLKIMNASPSNIPTN